MKIKKYRDFIKIKEEKLYERKDDFGFLTFEEKRNKLIITVNDKESFQEFLDDIENLRLGEKDKFIEMMSEVGAIGNGWQIIPPEDIGALTDAMIISNDFDINNNGKFTVNQAYWYPDYQIKSEIDVLKRKGKLEMIKVQ